MDILEGIPVERLIQFLNELGKDVDIVVKTKPRNRRARVSVYHSYGEARLSSAIAAKGKC